MQTISSVCNPPMFSSPSPLPIFIVIMVILAIVVVVIADIFGIVFAIFDGVLHHGRYDDTVTATMALTGDAYEGYSHVVA